MANRTPLYEAHLAAGGKMVDFSGWDMPIHYGSQIEEHNAVREDAGMFDVSHMTVVDVDGADATAWLRHLLANDVDSIPAGKALYTGMLNDEGGVIDDLIVYRRDKDYRLVVNCATRESDLEWMRRQAGDYAVTITERPEMAMLAVQGPNAREKLAALLDQQKADLVRTLKIFNFGESGDWLIARTGYTGEDGVEIILPGGEVQELWDRLKEAEVRPCGLGARDTLRLEAGLNLYGHEMDEGISPLEANMGWTVVFNEGRDFIGRAALERQREAGHGELVGLILNGKGVLRAHQKVITSDGEGETTSGSWSPTLNCAIALARLPAGTSGEVEVEIRNKRLPATVVKPPFVRNGKAVWKQL